MRKIIVNELMVGCYVGVNLHDEPDNFFEVVEIGETMKVKQGSTLYYFFIDDMEAIPLDETKLLRMGYYKDVDHFRVDGSDGVYKTFDIVNYTEHGGGGYFNRRINKYVHELQCMCYWLNGFMPSFQKLKK